MFMHVVDSTVASTGHAAGNDGPSMHPGAELAMLPGRRQVPCGQRGTEVS